MFFFKMTLPEYHMTAGETKNLTIPVYTTSGHQIDVSNMSARIAIVDYVNLKMAPYLVKDCEIRPTSGAALAAFFVTFEPEDTIELNGKYIYQITAKDTEEHFGIMQGVIMIAANYDRDAISL